MEGNLTLIVGAGEAPSPAPPLPFRQPSRPRESFRSKRGVPRPRSMAAPPRQRCNRPPLYRSEQRGDLPRACHPCLPPTYVMLFTSQALLSARFTIFYVTWMDSQFFRIVPRLQSGHVDRARQHEVRTTSLRTLPSIMSTSCYVLHPISLSLSLLSIILFNPCSSYVYVYFIIVYRLFDPSFSRSMLFSFRSSRIYI